MEVILAGVVGVLVAVGTYIVLQPSLVRVVIGVGILGNAANLLIFTSAGVSRAGPPLIEEGAKVLGTAADPLPQALILTAIVIGFGLQAFLLVLVRRTHDAFGTDDADTLTRTDAVDEAVAPAGMPGSGTRDASAPTSPEVEQ